MPCLEPEHSLSQEQVHLFLSAVREKPLNDEQIAAATGLPLFKVRSGLREMITVGYVQRKDDQFSLAPQGHNWLLFNRPK